MAVGEDSSGCQIARLGEEEDSLQLRKEKSPGEYCSIIVEALNLRDFEFTKSTQARELVDHVSPTWAGRVDGHPHLVTFEEQCEVWRQMCIDFPKIHFELLGVENQIHSKARTADVIMRTALKEGDRRYLTACLLKFKFSGGHWVWYFHSGIRGILDAYG